ncbi:glycoside hydrolase family 127 protein [Agromyces subbeticus]|uniref:glycoside hydrolase family 127 protein n=1 Tax=Agromyces subbeticus TaxID=293890 RepID=UPI0003B4C92C|nr:beta-L-arabinofuranosidase domain-containing protein [Agromyces subbeticus]
MEDIAVEPGVAPAPSVTKRPAVAVTTSPRQALGTANVRVTSGLLADWQHRNRTATIPHTIEQLRLAGNVDNLRRIAHPESPEAARPFRGRYPFLDTDVFKTLEGLAYELGRGDEARADAETAAFYDEAVDLIERAQRADGYLNSYFQAPDVEKEPWQDLAWGHELYNLGHLVQAAVAASRQLGDDRLLTVARRFADLAYERFGPDGDDIVCGHPEIEMALVELSRQTGDERYLELASLFIDRRGRGTVELSVFPAEYFQDNAPLRELDSVTGHAVRMTYLAAGAADVVLERSDETLGTALERLWNDMVDTKLYLTGGLGSRHSDEAIGDRFELPSERSYSETCAAIATMQWAWRMHLASGETTYLDVFETVLYNAYAAGLSDDGRAFFYDNPLQRRPDHQQRTGAEPEGELLRRGWFVCPCCPPNIIRWTAELQDHLALVDADTLFLAQYTGARIAHDGLELEMTTGYPWDGRVAIEVVSAAPTASRIALRVPAWCRGAQFTINGETVATDVPAGWLRVERALVAGDRLELDLPMPVRAHGADPRVDALRNSIAFARGPVVYCAEQADNDVELDELTLDAAAAAAALTTARAVTPNSRDETRIITMPARIAAPHEGGLYPELGTDAVTDAAASATTTATLVPYHLWGNRGAAAMRVWLRTA